MKIISILRRFPFTNFLYKKFHIEERVRFYHERNQMADFAKKGDGVIEYIHAVLKQSGNDFFIDAGTLIGIYRDGQLLKRDMDVDIAVKVNDQKDAFKIRKLLQENGFILKIMFRTSKDGLIQDAFDYNGIRVDLCYFKSSIKNDYCHILFDDNKIAKMTFSKIEATKLYKYKNQNVYIPMDTEKYLEERYGKKWRKPDPYFKYWKAPCVTIEEGKGICEFNK
ncbi:MAG: hypothetical protein E7099_08540 [Mediterranea massiliensis]|nr:hypothetical protein [Mediterranea massiliensis]